MVCFRPTAAQAAGRGAYLGGGVGLAGALLLLAVGGPLVAAPALMGILLAVPVLLGVAGGAGGAVLFGRTGGTDIDDLGLRSVPARSDAFTAWQRVLELRVQRRGGRTQIVAYLDTGQVVWLPAPYHGRLLAADPEFERKLFMLRNLWETHRTSGRAGRAA